MSPPLFDERPIALIWDFDETLIPGSMQKPLFEDFEVPESQFWAEANALPNFYRSRGLDLVSDDTLYLNHILSYVRAGKFPELSNAKLRELGDRIEFYPGLPDFFATAKDVVATDSLCAELGIVVEHYVVSTGLRQMILGSAIAPFVEFVWACEFVEQLAPPDYLASPPVPPTKPVIQDIGYTINNTTKTRAIFEINKGTNVDPRINVNASIAYEDRRVPFENMIYIADGPSDVPVFSILNQYGGKTFAVFGPDSDKQFDQVHGLREQGRVDEVGEANYELGTPTSKWILRAIRKTAKRMLETREAQREADFAARVGPPPRHLPEASAPPPSASNGD